jgi:hypothetical protein
MNETITPQAANESSRHYVGWGVVAAAFTGVMVSFAPIVPCTFSLFLNPLHAAFGWKREAIGGTFALAAITVALVSPGIGLLLDRFPPRRIILPSIVIFALALASLRRLDQIFGSSISHFLCWDWSPMEPLNLHTRGQCSHGFTSVEDSRSRWFSQAVELVRSSSRHLSNGRSRITDGAAPICCWAASLIGLAQHSVCEIEGKVAITGGSTG